MKSKPKINPSKSCDRQNMCQPAIMAQHSPHTEAGKRDPATLRAWERYWDGQLVIGRGSLSQVEWRELIARHARE